MKTVKIYAAWHITQVAYYLLHLAQKYKEPIQCNFQDFTIMIIPDEHKDDIIQPEWKERLIPEDEIINI